MPTPRSKIPGTPWWCVQDLENVKKTVDKNNRSIEQLEASFMGFQKQHQDWCSSVHNRCASLEALCEQLSGSVQNLLLSSNQQHQKARIDQLFEQSHQEHVRQTAEFNERLERFESKLDRSLSKATSAAATTDAGEAADALDGTLATLVNIKGSLQETHQAIADVCTEVRGREDIVTTSTMATGFQSATVPPGSPEASQHKRTKPSASATPRAQKRASAGAECRESSSGSNGGIAPSLNRATGTATPLKKRPARQAFLTQPMRQAVRSPRTQSFGRGHSGNLVKPQ